MARAYNKKRETKYKTPYRLGYLSQINRIAVKCDAHLFPTLRTFHDVHEHNPEAGTWFSIPGNRENILCLEALATPESIGEEYKQFRNELMDIPTTWASQAEAWCNIKRDLMNHQRQFVELAHDKIGMFNASEQGTGKTSPAFVLSKSLGATRVVVLCNKSMPGEWIREQSKLWDVPHFEMVDLVSDTIARRKVLAQEALLTRTLAPCKSTIAMVNYEALSDLVELLVLWKPQILWIDESWRVKNPKALMTASAMYLSEHCSQKFPMAGTVIGNHVGDLWSQLYIIDRDALGGMSYDDFLARFATFQAVNTAQGARSMPVGVSDPVGLMKLLDKYWYRATKETCLTLPPKQYERVDIPLSSETAKLYNAVKVNGMSALGDDLSLEGDRVVRLRLHQIAGGFKPVATTQINKHGKPIWRVEPIACAKLEWLIQWAEDHVSEDSEVRCIVWVKFNAEGERIKNALEKKYGKGKAVFAYATTKKEDLESWKDSFNARLPDGVKWFVCQTQKMCSGHNMQAGDNHFFFSNTYSHIYRSQAEDRSHRNGRESGEGITIYDLISKSTIDEEIYNTLQRKQSLSTRLTPATANDTMGEEDQEDEENVFEQDIDSRLALINDLDDAITQCKNDLNK